MTPLLQHPNPLQYDLARELKACQSQSRRNGKVARLPFALRQQINHMIEDGLPYKTIIQQLGDAGKHLNEDNLSNWRLGGYQDYLKEQAIRDRARVQTEAAADVARSTGHLGPEQLKRVCSEIALLQYMITLMEHGDQLARDSLKKNPAKMITLINASCNMATSSRLTEKRKSRLNVPPSNSDPAATS